MERYSQLLLRSSAPGSVTPYMFEHQSLQHLQMLTARNPTSLAFSGDHLYLVESSFCKGSAFDRHLGLEGFAISGAVDVFGRKV